MSDELYAAVDDYLEGLFGDDTAAQAAALERASAAGLPPINVSPTIGRFLKVLALACGARRILEIGTLGGYSTIWLARALPAGGSVISLEVEPRHAEVAAANIAAAGLADRVEITVGAAVDSLAAMRDAGAGPFDMVFIDADKPAYPAYLDGAVALCRQGSLIVADNVVRRGLVTQADTDDAAAQGARAFNAAVATHPRLTAAFVQQVGVKGHDGMAVAVVTDP